MAERRGTVFIAPVASYLPSGRMVDPDTSTFSVSWQDNEQRRSETLADADEIEGADVAIAWGRERCDRVLIRLAHTAESHFSAGRVRLTPNTDGSGEPLPVWPPAAPPPEGWWTPADEAAAFEAAVEEARREPLPVDPRRLGVSGPWTGLDDGDEHNTTG
jgi:hypothetical protein